MIVRTRRDRTVSEHRRIRLASSLQTPVLVVPPDTRRQASLRVAQLTGMGLDTGMARQRRGSDRAERWWKAWTAVHVETLYLLQAENAEPVALEEYLSEVEPLVDTVVVLEGRSRTDTYEGVMSGLGAQVAPAAEPVGPVDGTRCGPAFPDVPHASTPHFLALAGSTLPVDDYRTVEAHYRETFAAATRQLGDDPSPHVLLGLLRRSSANCRARSEFLTTLCALEAAIISLGVPARLDPRRVWARSGHALSPLLDPVAVRSASRQMDAGRAVSMLLGSSGMSATEILDLRLSDVDGLAVAKALTEPLEALIYARRTGDGAADDDQLINDPIVPITDRTVGRWVRLGRTEHLLPGIGHTAPRRRREPLEQLEWLGVRWSHV